MTTNWDWEYRPGNEDRDAVGPSFISAHYIHSINPQTKLIVILRDPLERYIYMLIKLCWAVSRVHEIKTRQTSIHLSSVCLFIAASIISKPITRKLKLSVLVNFSCGFVNMGPQVNFLLNGT